MKNIFHKSCKKAMKVENIYKHSGGVGELVGLPYFGYTYRAGGDVAAMAISWWGEVRTQRQASRTTPYLYALIHFYSFLNLSSSLSLIYVFSLYSCHSGDGNISSNWSQNVNIVPRHTQPSTVHVLLTYHVLFPYTLTLHLIPLLRLLQSIVTHTKLKKVSVLSHRSRYC